MKRIAAIAALLCSCTPPGALMVAPATRGGHPTFALAYERVSAQRWLGCERRGVVCVAVGKQPSPATADSLADLAREVP